MNMAKYGSRWSQQPDNVNFEPTFRGLKSNIFFTETKCKICFIRVRFNCEKWGDKMDRN